MSGNITITQFAQVLGHSEPELRDRMKRDGILQECGLPYSVHMRRRYFATGELGGHVIDVGLTGKGQIWLARRYPAGFELAERKLGARKRGTAQ